MKNNKNLKVACGLLALVLLTTSVIGTTLARYTTADSASDTARVAKWGIELAVGGTLFGTDYAANDATENADQIVAATSQSVSGSANVVAPGTKNDVGFRLSIAGTPEVAYDVIVTDNKNESIYLAGGYTYGVMLPEYGVNNATDLSNLYVIESSGAYVKATAYDADETYYRLHDGVSLTDSYYPVEWTVKGTGNLASLNKTTRNLATLATEIGAAVEALEGDAKANSAASFTLTWAWAIDGNDAADTILGNLIAGGVEGQVVAQANGTTKFYAVSVTDNVAKFSNYVVANLDVSYEFGARVEQVD